MARLNLYLSDDLKVRMEAVEEAVNWSRIATTAFEGKLAEIATGRELLNMNEIVQRLRASKLKDEASTTSEGHKAGMRWGAEEAEWWQLEELQVIFGKWKEADWGHWNPDNPVSYRDYARGGLPFFGPDPAGPIWQHVLRVAGVMVPPEEQDKKDVLHTIWNNSLDWWKKRGAGDEPSTIFVREFVAGALKVFEEVREQVEGER